MHRFKKTPEYHLIILSFLLNLPWELAQLPLFSFKGYEDPGTILYAIVHCTIGDVLITLGVFEVFSLLNRSRFWFLKWETGYLFLYVLLGITYTILSEIKNVYYYGNWMYNDSMPLIPVVEVGLVPVFAWLWIPLVTLYMMKRRFVTLVC